MAKKIFAVALTAGLLLPCAVEAPVFKWRKTDPRLERESVITYSEEESPPKLKAVLDSISLTAYSSSTDETDSRPFETASQEHVVPGGAAWNGMSFGTVFMLPEVFPGQVFFVNDRKDSRYDSTWVDLWLPSKAAALEFGRKKTSVWILNPRHPENAEAFEEVAAKRVRYRDVERGLVVIESE